MSNPIKDEFDKMSLVKDISDREKIINKYQATGMLERDDAIKKITELRITDNEVAVVTTAKLAMHSVPFDKASDEQIVNELMMQTNLLRAKLIKKQFEK